MGRYETISSINILSFSSKLFKYFIKKNDLINSRETNSSNNRDITPVSPLPLRLLRIESVKILLARVDI